MAVDREHPHAELEQRRAGSEVREGLKPWSGQCVFAAVTCLAPAPRHTPQAGRLTHVHDRHPGGPEGVAAPAPLHGRWVAAITPAVSGSTSAANASGNASRSRYRFAAIGVANPLRHLRCDAAYLAARVFPVPMSVALGVAGLIGFQAAMPVSSASPSQPLVLRLDQANKVGGVVVAPPDIGSIGLDRHTDAARHVHSKRSGIDVGVSKGDPLTGVRWISHRCAPSAPSSVGQRAGFSRTSRVPAANGRCCVSHSGAG